MVPNAGQMPVARALRNLKYEKYWEFEVHRSRIVSSSIGVGEYTPTRDPVC